MSLGIQARLARWLGPWAAQDRHPPVRRAEARGAVRARVYTPVGRSARGSLLLLPGLHPQGPDDPRLDRFAAVLAGAGLHVHAPFLSAFQALRLAPGLVDEAHGALDDLLAAPDRPPGRPGVFSISFGSLPALRLAAERADDLRAALLFGGYADWRRAMIFCLTGGEGVAHDPLNRPVVYLNLLDALPGVPPDPAPLVAAWRRYIDATWGRIEMKAADAWPPVARALAADLPESLRPLFLEGCGVDCAGVTPRLTEALAAAGDRSYLDPAPALAADGAPVYVVHGADDDVIPHTEADALWTALPPARRAGRHITGLYGHTGAAGGHGPLTLARELAAMTGILRAITRTAGV